MYRGNEKLKQPPPVSTPYLYLFCGKRLIKVTFLDKNLRSSFTIGAQPKKYLWKLSLVNPFQR
jgi:hypothetical protein